MDLFSFPDCNCDKKQGTAEAMIQLCKIMTLVRPCVKILNSPGPFKFHTYCLQETV